MDAFANTGLTCTCKEASASSTYIPCILHQRRPPANPPTSTDLPFADEGIYPTLSHLITDSVVQDTTYRAQSPDGSLRIEIHEGSDGQESNFSTFDGDDVSQYATPTENLACYPPFHDNRSHSTAFHSSLNGHSRGGGRDYESLSSHSQDTRLRNRKVYQPLDPFEMSHADFAKLRGEQRMEEMKAMGQNNPNTCQGEGGSASKSDATINGEAKAGTSTPTFTDRVMALLVDTIALQIYHTLMLQLPELYRIRIVRLFEHAEKSLPDVAKLLASHPPDSVSGASNGGTTDGTQDVRNSGLRGRSSRNFKPISRTNTTFTLASLEKKDEPLSYKRMKDSWEDFIKALLSEWATFNILTVLLLSAIIAILQIDAASGDIVIRTSALLSLVFALLSLVSGCIYIGRFHEMRKAYRGAHWAYQVSELKGTNLFWNAWVFLAMPAVWLAWALVSFVVCMLAYVWRIGDPSQSSPIPFTKGTLLGSRISITTVFGIGCFYLVLSGIMFRAYEKVYQESTHKIIMEWLKKIGCDSTESEGDSAEGEVKGTEEPRSNGPILMASPSTLRTRSQQHLNEPDEPDEGSQSADSEDIEDHEVNPERTTQIRFANEHTNAFYPSKSILKNGEPQHLDLPLTLVRPNARNPHDGQLKGKDSGVRIVVVPPGRARGMRSSALLHPTNMRYMSKGFRNVLSSTPLRPIMRIVVVSRKWKVLLAWVKLYILWKAPRREQPRRLALKYD